MNDIEDSVDKIWWNLGVGQRMELEWSLDLFRSQVYKLCVISYGDLGREDSGNTDFSFVHLGEWYHNPFRHRRLEFFVFYY